MMPAVWYSFDAIFDLVYILDILVHMNTSFLDKGLRQTTRSLVIRNYICSRYLPLDMLSLLPLEFLYFQLGKTEKSIAEG